MTEKLNVKKGIPYAVLLLVFLVLPIFLHTSYWIGVLIMVLYKVVGSVSLRTMSTGSPGPSTSCGMKSGTAATA